MPGSNRRMGASQFKLLHRLPLGGRGASLSRAMETLKTFYDSVVEHPFTNGVLPHLLTVVGFLLAFLAIARLMSAIRRNTDAVGYRLAQGVLAGTYEWLEAGMVAGRPPSEPTDFDRPTEVR